MLSWLVKQLRSYYVAHLKTVQNGSSSLHRQKWLLWWSAPTVLLTILWLKLRHKRLYKEIYTSLRPTFYLTSLSPPHASDYSQLPVSTHLTLWLHTLLPLSLQTYLRDSGIVAQLIDWAAQMGDVKICFGMTSKQLEKYYHQHEDQTKASQSQTHPWLTPGRGRIFDINYDLPTQTDATAPTAHTFIPHPRRTLDIFYQQHTTTSNGSQQPLSPVLIWVHGGAWGCCSSLLFRLLSYTLSHEYVTVSANYRIWPLGNAQDQVEDVDKVVQWVTKYIHHYGGDPARIFIMGHSSGAHISSLYTLQATKRAVALKQSVPIKGVICLAAPFDIVSHYDFESARGVAQVSPMKAACGPTPQLMLQHSSTHVASMLTAEERSFLPPFFIGHGAHDTTVPYGQSVRFAHILAPEIFGSQADTAIKYGYLNEKITEEEIVQKTNNISLQKIVSSSSSSSSSSPTFSLPHPLVHFHLFHPSQLTNSYDSSSVAITDHMSIVVDLMSGEGRNECIRKSIRQFMTEALLWNQLRYSQTSASSSTQINPTSSSTSSKPQTETTPIPARL